MSRQTWRVPTAKRYNYNQKQRILFQQMLNGGNSIVGWTPWVSKRYAGNETHGKCIIVNKNVKKRNYITPDKPRWLKPYQVQLIIKYGWLPIKKKTKIEISHICGNERCIKKTHLEYTTHSINMQRLKHHNWIEKKVRKLRQTRIKDKKQFGVEFHSITHYQYPKYDENNEPNGCKHEPTCFKNYQPKY